MDADLAFQLDSLDNRPPMIQSDVLGVIVEMSSLNGRLEKSHQNYFCTFPDEVELMKLAEAMINTGIEIVSVLYSYRSVSQSIPDISLSDYATEELTVEEKAELAAKTVEINQKLIEILRPEIGKMVSIMSYALNIINLVNSFVVYGSKRKEGLPQEFRSYFLELLDIAIKVIVIFLYWFEIGSKLSPCRCRLIASKTSRPA